MANTITADDIREHFSQAMSAMYQQEVPQYGTLLELVADVNLAVLENNPLLHEQLANADELARLNVERHGRSASARRRNFQPCAVCLPLWGCTRSAITISPRRGAGPLNGVSADDDAALCRNPFRIFTSLLRLELIENVALRERARRSCLTATSSPRAVWR
jgi:uncharacterized glyoxalase superfamily metalloenzyme YdcJ